MLTSPTAASRYALARALRRLRNSPVARRLLCGLAMTVALSAQASGPSWIVRGATGDGHVELLECASGRSAGRTTLDSPLAAPPVLAGDGSAVYVVTRASQLLRLTVPGLAAAARAALGFEPVALALGEGSEAIVLAGGRGDDPLSAHDPGTLAALQRYRQRDGATATVSALLHIPGRSAIVVGFGDLAETWEIRYDHAAPPVLLGLVHDYRNNEAVPLPGRLTARPFVVTNPTREFALGPVPWELARIDEHGALGVINLEVRREIERPAIPPPGGPGRVAAWREASDHPPAARASAPGARGWITASEGSGALTPLRALSWRPLPPIDVGGEVLAIAPQPWGSRVLVAHRLAEAISVSTVDPATGTITRETTLRWPPGSPQLAPDTSTRAHLPRAPQVRFAQGSGGACVALIDASGRWIGSLSAPHPAAVGGDAASPISR